MNPFLNEDSALDEAIASALTDLKSFSADEEGYQKAVDQLSKLYKLKHDNAKIALEAHNTAEQHTLARQQWVHEVATEALPFYRRVDPNTVLTVAGNIFIGLAVIKYEQTGVISTKVMSFMKKM